MTMDALTLLHTRNSAAKLTIPAPSGAELDDILAVVLRSPDHARLRPWRLLTITGDALHSLGELYARALLNRDPGATEDAVSKARAQPLRAPLIVVVIASIQEHEKVPREEQLISAGCAAHGILLAAQAKGFAGIWRTGKNAYDGVVKDGLGLLKTEEVVGFLYLGTIDGNYKPLANLALSDFVEDWSK